MSKAIPNPNRITEAGYTPGPWTTVCNDVSGSRPVGDDGVRYCEVVQENIEGYRGAVCSVSAAEHIHGISLAERNANARLLSAAPDLLAALQLILTSHDIACKGEECQLSGIDVARFAIRKATGAL